MKLRRILFPYNGSDLGGSHISSMTLGQALIAAGFPVTIIANDGSMIAEDAARRGLDVVPIREKPLQRHGVAYDLMRYPARAALLRRLGKGSIVHTHDIGSQQSWGLPAKFLGFPLVYHSRAFNRPVLQNRLPVRLADQVVCVSKAAQEIIRTYMPAERVHTIDNPFAISTTPDREQTRTAIVRELGLSSDDLLIGFAANFVERKRPFFFLEACREIAMQRDDARFIVFGRKADYTLEQLQDHAERLGITEKTRFAGFRMPGEANITAMDVHLIPSLAEPFGRTLIESTLLGTPYVAMDDGGNPEITGRWGGGVLLPVETDAKGFAAAALRIAADPGQIRLAASRRSEIASELAPGTHVEKMLKIYRQLAG